MDNRVTIISLGVDDLDRAIAFYEGLGWERGAKAFEGIAFFRLKGLIFSLYPKKGVAEELKLKPDDFGISGMVLAHNVESEAKVDALLQEASAQGAKLVRSGEKVFWGGYRGIFQDLDGYHWEIAHNPFLLLDENGLPQLED